MATRTAAKPAANLPAPLELSAADFTALLRGAGAVDTPGESSVKRIKVDGTTFNVGDDVFFSNPKTGDPAFVAQIVDAPMEYQARWFDDDGILANYVGRPEIAGTMCKSHYDIPTEARNKAEDGTDCRTCPVNPYVKRDALPAEARGQKCGWRGDLELRILDDDGQVSDDTVWTLSLPMTSMQEWKGFASSANPDQGHTGELNFQERLVRLGASKDPENPQRGAMHALTALRLGGVLAEVRSVQVQSEKSGNRYHVVQLNPIDIVEVSESPALTGGEAEDVDESVPF